ncbi:cyclase family protein [Affinibrenneria salicis]|uniref:Cyclase family protein n=1 Tax=Affinibrenneria salicis TaxID=2590031 RepID=A0A5J5FTG7_9GAMM|nr:cyclase family protein [Affinibrenneria salicis]KAA8996429.1 cyclase family protein [Affinibrenneria salicis]
MTLDQIIHALKKKKWVDLTHPVTSASPVFSAFSNMRSKTLFTVEQHGFYAQEITFTTPTGTHIDAPGHFVADKRCLDGVDSKELLLPLLVIHKEAEVARDADYRLSVGDIAQFERQYGAIPAGSFVAFASDWCRRWPDADAFANRDAQGDSHTPGWSLEALRFLFEQRGVSAIGHETLDTDAGVDFRRNNGLDGEYYVLNRNACQVEVLNNLSLLPATGAWIHVSWPNFAAMPSFPARVTAWLPEDE